MVATPFNEETPSFSPDSRWIAFASNESGRYEIYVQPYPGPGGKRPISTDGGREPLWSRDGRELFYRQGDYFMAVPIETDPELVAGKPQALFEDRYVSPFTSPSLGESTYDLSPDGQHFVMIQPDERLSRNRIHVVIN